MGRPYTNYGPIGRMELDDYAEVMIDFRAWCELAGVNFRRELARYARARMARAALAGGPPTPTTAPVADPEAAADGADATAPRNVDAPPPPVVRVGRASPGGRRRGPRPGSTTRADGGPRRPGGTPAHVLACDDFPGRTFSAKDVRELCGLAKLTPLTKYLRDRRPIGGKHVFRIVGRVGEDRPAGGPP
jgi:hypothetical protein